MIGIFRDAAYFYKKRAYSSPLISFFIATPNHSRFFSDETWSTASETNARLTTMLPEQAGVYPGSGLSATLPRWTIISALDSLRIKHPQHKHPSRALAMLRGLIWHPRWQRKTIPFPSDPISDTSVYNKIFPYGVWGTLCTAHFQGILRSQDYSK